jgi:Ni,Fe-hydrogenase III large subunit
MLRALPSNSRCLQSHCLATGLYAIVLSYKIMIMRMFAILDKANPDIESIRGLNLEAVKHTTVQVTRLPF